MTEQKDIYDSFEDWQESEIPYEEKEGQFKLKTVTKIEDLLSKKVTIIPESDFTIQTDNELIQFDYKETEEENKVVVIKPGCYNIEMTAAGVKLRKTELRKYNLLKTIDNTTIINVESDKFFNRLDVYKRRKRDPKRAILLCSPPGVGKTAALNEVCRKYLSSTDNDTTVLIWDTSAIRPQSVNNFFLNQSRFKKDVKKLIFVIEDIGGGSVDNYNGSVRGADSSLLNLLDGMGNPFKGVPTFIIATTNNPETSVEALVDRPGRFDKVIELKMPSEANCIDLLKFIMEKAELTVEEIEAAKLAAKNKFSIAHIQECVIRSELDDTSILEATQQLVVHKKRFKEAFMEAKTMGIGIRR